MINGIVREFLDTQGSMLNIQFSQLIAHSSQLKSSKLKSSIRTHLQLLVYFSDQVIYIKRL